MSKRGLLVLIGSIFFIMAASSYASDDERCFQCGMFLKNYPHSVYTITWKDGGQSKMCGVQCGLTQQLLRSEEFKSAEATDLISNRKFPAQKGFYVYQSSAVTDMAPGFIAFKKRTDAEKFQKGFGGKVVTFEEALQVWSRKKKGKKH